MSTAPPQRTSHWSAGRIVGIVVSSIAALIGLALLIGGLALIAAHTIVRDDDGFYTTDRERLSSDAYAITSGEIDLGADPIDWAPEELLGEIRIRAEGAAGEEVFLGIGRDVDVDRYLRGVGSSEVVDFLDEGPPSYRESAGDAPRRPPGAERFWVAESEGPGDREVEWEAESGIWSVVVMNADATRRIDVDVDVGANVDWVLPAGIVLAAIGLLLSVTGTLLVVYVGRRSERAAAVQA